MNVNEMQEIVDKYVVTDAIGKGHLEKCHELIENAAEAMKAQSQRLMKSGAIDYSIYHPDEYTLAKIIVTACIMDASSYYRPLHPSHLKEVENIRHF